MNEIKYTYIKKKEARSLFWIFSILGALMFSIFGGLNAAHYSNVFQGLRDAGLVLLSGTIAFFIGMLVKVKENKI